MTNVFAQMKSTNNLSPLQYIHTHTHIHKCRLRFYSNQPPSFYVPLGSSADIPLIFHNVLVEQKLSESRTGLGNMKQHPKVLDDEKPPTRGNIHHNVELNGSSKASTYEKQHKRAETNTSETDHLQGIVLTKPISWGKLILFSSWSRL